jgi:hypothetical protein
VDSHPINSNSNSNINININAPHDAIDPNGPIVVPFPPHWTPLRSSPALDRHIPADPLPSDLPPSDLLPSDQRQQ